MSMTEAVDSVLPNYFKSFHAKAEYYCRILDYEKCEPALIQAYKRKPFDYGIIGNVRFYLIEHNKSTLLLDRINHIVNPFSPGVYSFYRNSLLKTLALSNAEALAKNFSQWNSNHDNWYVISQTKADRDDVLRFSRWYRQELSEKPLKRVSKYNAYMLLNADFPVEAKALYKDGLENQPYFDLLIIELMADIWINQPNIQKWQLAKQKAEDRREFQNALDKLYLAYFDMYFDNKRGARGYIEEIFPELMSDEITITKDNFRFAVYFNETIKEIGDHRRSLSLDFALNNFLQKHPELKRNASFGLADVEFYALTGRETQAAKKLIQAVEQDEWMPNAFWMWPPLDANPFLAAIRATAEYDQARLILKQRYSGVCLTDCE